MRFFVPALNGSSLSFSLRQDETILDLLHRLSVRTGVPHHLFYLVQHSKVLPGSWGRWLVLAFPMTPMFTCAAGCVVVRVVVVCRLKVNGTVKLVAWLGAGLRSASVFVVALRVMCRMVVRLEENHVVLRGSKTRWVGPRPLPPQVTLLFECHVECRRGIKVPLCLFLLLAGTCLCSFLSCKRLGSRRRS